MLGLESWVQDLESEWYVQSLGFRLKSGVSDQESESGVRVELCDSPTTPAQVSRRWSMKTEEQYTATGP